MHLESPRNKYVNLPADVSILSSWPRPHPEFNNSLESLKQVNNHHYWSIKTKIKQKTK